jgi:ribosomal protein L32
MHSTNCANCDRLLTPDQNFCEKCGQQTAIHRISFGHVIHDGVHHITHADKGIFYLLKQLAVRPGHVAKEYIDGKGKNTCRLLASF